MKRFFLTTLAALAITTCQGSVLTYKLNYTITRNGAGTTSMIRATGWAVLDTDTLELALIKDNALLKRFNIEYPTGDFTDISSALGKSHSVIEIDEGYISGKMLIKGLNSAINFHGAPSTMTISGFDTYEMFWTTAPFIDEYKGSMIFDRLKTNDYNLRFLTFAQAVESIRLYFLAKGHLESPSF
jgi:hypothetical protein